MNINDTICAISTKLGESAINIVRMSGEDSLNIISKILSEDFSKNSSRTLHLKKIYDNDELIDVCLVTYFEEKKSYNNELIVEINTHGGIIVAQKVLKLLVNNGCRMAEPGEFTKRAFLNNKMTVDEIEAISNVIKSETDLQHSVSMNQFSGSFSNNIEKIKSILMDIIAAVEVNIDYPEYDETEEITKEFLEKNIDIVYNELLKVKKRINNGKVLKEGINAAIIGKPNVGKSSFLNSLTNEDTSIVTNIEGTTRDIISEKVKINDFVINILDTAGIRNDSIDTVEKIGIEKSKKAITSADIVFVVVDLSKKLDELDYEILKSVENKNHIIIGNKLDISINENFDFKLLEISAKNHLNIDLFENEITNKLFSGNVSSNEFYFISNLEKISYVDSALQFLESIKNNAKEDNIFIDFIIYDLTNCFEEISKINNSSKDGEILDRLFSSYCLGK